MIIKDFLDEILEDAGVYNDVELREKLLRKKLTFIEDEDGADQVEALLKFAESGKIELQIAFVTITITEVYYITLQEKGVEEAKQRIELIESLALIVRESDKPLNLTAGTMKASNSISLADAYVAAVCQEYNSVLVHKDPEFEKFSDILKQEKLPYK